MTSGELPLDVYKQQLIYFVYGVMERG